MLRSVEAVGEDRLHEVKEQVAGLVEGLEEAIALRRALVEHSIASARDTEQKAELRSLARVLNRHGEEVKARIELVLNSLERLS